MSLNRLIYDDCAYSKRLKESTGPLNYLLNPQKYENCHKCRVELGLFGGTNVSIGAGNLVDAESDLSGRTRLLSQCPTKKYAPKCSDPNNKCTYDTGIPFDCDACQPQKRHLRPCSLFQYKPRPNNVGYRIPEYKCPPSDLNQGRTVRPGLNYRGPSPYVPNEWQGQQGVRPPVKNPRRAQKLYRDQIYN